MEDVKELNAADAAGQAAESQKTQSSPADEEDLSLFQEFFQFLKEEKVYWIAPIVLVLLFLGALLILTEGSAVAPFIYTLF